MASSAHIVLLIITFIAMCFSMAGIATGALGYSWWKSAFSDDGLWKGCIGNDICTERKYVLEFKDIVGYRLGYREKDIILILLIGAGFLGALTLTTLTCMFCCLQRPGGWRCGAVLAALCSFFAGSAALGAVIYAEIKFENTWEQVDHGWSVIGAWIGAVLCILVFFLSIILSCISPRSRQPDSFSYNQQHYADAPQYNQQQPPPQYQPGYDNVGYQLK